MPSVLLVLPEGGPTFLFFQAQLSIKKKTLSKRSQEQRKFRVERTK